VNLLVGSQVFVNDFTAPVLRPNGSLNALVGNGQEVNGNWSRQIQLARSGVVLERWILNLNRKQKDTTDLALSLLFS